MTQLGNSFIDDAITWLGHETSARKQPSSGSNMDRIKTSQVPSNSSVTLLFPSLVLQVSHGQRIKRLTACLTDQTLRIDCAYERKTNNPLSYEFLLSKGPNDRTVLASNLNVVSAPYKPRTNVNVSNNLVCLYFSGFSTSDEGVYTCNLKITNDYDIKDMQSKNISVIKGESRGQAGKIRAGIGSILLEDRRWVEVTGKLSQMVEETSGRKSSWTPGQVTQEEMSSSWLGDLDAEFVDQKAPRNGVSSRYMSQLLPN
ncbi:Thy-1 membrane glycoprotein, partial [Ophiophagus hannah]